MRRTNSACNREWGFLRETGEMAKNAGIDQDIGLHRTGLEDYLKIIFPHTTDWIHDKSMGKLPNGSVCRKRPDYRSDSLKLIIEFDGLQHYNNPLRIHQDIENTLLYQSLGYKVIRIPYFIQLTNSVVKTLFGVEIAEPLFDESIPSLGPKGRNTPAFLCYQGIKRMAEEYKKFPEQYKVNIDFLKQQEDQYLVEFEVLEQEYNKLAIN